MICILKGAVEVGILGRTAMALGGNMEESDRGGGRPPVGRAPRSIAPAITWRPESALTVPDWIETGKSLGTIGRGASWWIGDWVNYGNQHFGEKYTRAAQITGYDVQTLMNMAYVALRFDSSRRRENLSWSHHAEVASLPFEQRERWLDVAQSRRLSVHNLRGELRAWRAGLTPGQEDAARQAAGGGTDPAGNAAVTAAADRGERSFGVCPHCGRPSSEVPPPRDA